MSEPSPPVPIADLPFGGKFAFLHIMRAGKGLVPNKKNYRSNPGLTYHGVFAELLREPAHCLHVRDPLPPLHLFGTPAEELERILDDWYLNTRESRQGETGPYLSRVRPDRQRLQAGVVSFPVRRELIGPEDEGLADLYFEGCRAFFGGPKLYGADYRAQYRHVDEEYLHDHHFGLSLDPKVELNPLYAAKLESKRRGDTPAEQNKVLKAAGNELQLAFYREVSRPLGLGYKDTSKRSLRIPNAYKRQMLKLERLLAESGQEIFRFSSENKELRQRVEELTAKAEEHVEALLAAQETIQVHMRANAVLAERAAAAEASAAGLSRRLAEEFAGRIAAEDLCRVEIERRRVAERKTVLAEGQSANLSDELAATTDALADREHQTEVLAYQVRGLESQIAEKDGTITEQAALIRRLSGGGSGDGGLQPILRTPSSKRKGGGGQAVR